MRYSHYFRHHALFFAIIRLKISVDMRVSFANVPGMQNVCKKNFRRYALFDLKIISVIMRVSFWPFLPVNIHQPSRLCEPIQTRTRIKERHDFLKKIMPLKATKIF